MSDHQRRNLDNARRADAAKKEDYLPRLREFKSHSFASWTGVSIGNANAGCPWRTGHISEMSPYDIARFYFRSFKREWEVFLSLLLEKYNQDFMCFVRDTLKSRQLANAFRRGYSRFLLTTRKSGYGGQCDYHFILDSSDPMNVHFFYSLLAAFSHIRDTGGLPSNAPIYFFIDQIRDCRLAKSKVMFRKNLPAAVLNLSCPARNSAAVILRPPSNCNCSMRKRVHSARDYQTRLVRLQDFARSPLAALNLGAPDFQQPRAAQRCPIHESAGPRGKGAHSIPQFQRGLRPIQPPVRLGDLSGVGCRRVVLRLRRDAAGDVGGSVSISNSAPITASRSCSVAAVSSGSMGWRAGSEHRPCPGPPPFS
jgi:hypothetical protein